MFGYQPILLDLGPESAVSWLSAIAARDLDLPRSGLDTAARELHLDGRRIALSKLESDVVRYLIEREGQPVARDTLLRDVWGFRHAPRTRTVDVHVAWLRAKLEPDRGHPRYLRTVRGAGYKFVAE